MRARSTSMPICLFARPTITRNVVVSVQHVRNRLAGGASRRWDRNFIRNTFAAPIAASSSTRALLRKWTGNRSVTNLDTYNSINSSWIT
ncbi:unnamed protein product [Gongylonema pulchrum]|uniref:Secreted protein n=1 Tax=Gongylonema pulchrum TaxID=637853 RepID=A0A183E210_9BILA|nr:unnamed protein product [Gongylonema pulchrum]